MLNFRETERTDRVVRQSADIQLPNRPLNVLTVKSVLENNRHEITLADHDGYQLFTRVIYAETPEMAAAKAPELVVEWARNRVNMFVDLIAACEN